MKNLLTDVPGLKVGNAQDARLASGTTVVVFDAPAAAGIAVPGGAPALRDTGLLKPEMTVARVDAFVLSGGSVFGLDAPGGAMAWLHAHGRGFAVGAARAPIVPGAALFDLDNGGDKDWGRRPPYCRSRLGRRRKRRRWTSRSAASAPATARRPATSRAGSARRARSPSRGFVVGALAAVNAAGRATRGSSPRFWAARLRARRANSAASAKARRPDDALDLRAEARRRAANTTLAVVATDAPLDKAQATRVAIMAHGRLRAGAAAGPRADRTATSCSPPRPRARRARPTCAISPKSARSPPNASRARSRAASTRRRRCPMPGRSRSRGGKAVTGLVSLATANRSARNGAGIDERRLAGHQLAPAAGR